MSVINTLKIKNRTIKTMTGNTYFNPTSVLFNNSWGLQFFSRIKGNNALKRRSGIIISVDNSPANKKRWLSQKLRRSLPK